MRAPAHAILGAADSPLGMLGDSGGLGRGKGQVNHAGTQIPTRQRISNP